MKTIIIFITIVFSSTALNGVSETDLYYLDPAGHEIKALDMTIDYVPLDSLPGHKKSLRYLTKD